MTSTEGPLVRGLPLSVVLGGHSFTKQLGSDAIPSADEQVAIVEACLDAGIRWFDTTYKPERVARGNALARLARRAEATIIAWNSLTPFGAGDEVGDANYYQPEHIGAILEEFRTGPPRLPRLARHAR